MDFGWSLSASSNLAPCIYLLRSRFLYILKSSIKTTTYFKHEKIIYNISSFHFPKNKGKISQ